jgi:hypothetical protein
MILKPRVKGRTHTIQGRLPDDVQRINSEEDLQPVRSSLSHGVLRLLLPFNVMLCDCVGYTVARFGWVVKRFREKSVECLY